MRGAPRRRGGTFGLRLSFAVHDPDADRPAVYAQWSDNHIVLEDRIPEIASGIRMAACAALRSHRKKAKSLLEAELFRVLDRLKLDSTAADNFASRCDPRTSEALLEMAERHRKAVLVRHFLRSLSKTIANGSIEVAGREI